MKKSKLLAIVLCVCCAFLPCLFAACTDNPEEQVPPGSKLYVYEAEDTDISNLSGPVFSGEASGYKMIKGENTKHIRENKKVLDSISNKYFVSYFNGLDSTMTFEFESNEASEGNKLVLRMASEWGTLKVNPNNIEIKINGDVVSYNELTVPGEKLSDNGSYSEYRTPFRDYTITEGMKIVNGTNTVTLTVKSRDYGLAGLEKYGPGIDCIKITTADTTNLTWEKLFEENKGSIAYEA